jgi:hypothetical protein
MHEVNSMIGPGSEQSDPRLRSYLARNIVFLALRLAAGESHGIDLRQSYSQRLAGPSGRTRGFLV